jgi:hypothetical protein
VAAAAEEPGQAEPVAAAALNRERMHGTKGDRPRQQLGVALVGGVNEQLAETAAKAVERDSDVLIFVRVNTDDDVAAFKRDASHDC